MTNNEGMRLALNRIPYKKNDPISKSQQVESLAGKADDGARRFACKHDQPARAPAQWLSSHLLPVHLRRRFNVRSSTLHITQRRYPISTEQNKAIVRRFVEDTLSTLDVALADELLAPNYVNHMIPGGREGLKQFAVMLRSAFPDFKQEIRIERLFAEGDYVMMRASVRLTNAGEVATGSGLGEYRLANAKIVEDWPLSGVAELLQQIGVALAAG
jgi:predicted SnoaL-like aldol condensation-catalyzing enzyme